MVPDVVGSQVREQAVLLKTTSGRHIRYLREHGVYGVAGGETEPEVLGSQVMETGGIAVIAFEVRMLSISVSDKQ